MQERQPKNNVPSEEIKLEESEIDIDLFIDNLFPSIFESILELKPIRDLILPEMQILFTEAYPFIFRFNVYRDNNIYDFTYGAMGKKDRAFNMTTNPSFIDEKQTFDSMFVLMDSPNAYFNDPISNSTYAISTIQHSDNGIIKAVDDADACKEGTATLNFIKNLSDATVILDRKTCFFPGELPALYE